MPRFIVGQDGSEFTVLFESWKNDKTDWETIARCPSREHARAICEALRHVRGCENG